MTAIGAGRGDPEPVGGLTDLEVLQFPGRAADFCGYVLGHLGARVVKLRTGNPAGSGDLLPAEDAGNDADSFAVAYDEAKEIVEIDPGTDPGRTELEVLVAAADVVVTDAVSSGRPPMSHDRLVELNPTVIHADLSTWGSSGPKSGLPGGDLVATAQSGFLHLTGTPGQRPVRMGADQAVKLGGAEAAAAVTIALLHRDRTGCGQHIDVAVRDAMIRATVNAIPKYRYENVVQARVGDHWGIRDRPLKALWKCRDGWVSFVRRGGALGGRVNEACIEWMAEHGIDPGELGSVDWNRIDIGEPADRARIDELDGLFEGFLEARSAEEVFREGMERGMTLAPVRTLDEVLDEEQLSTRDYWRTGTAGGRDIRLPRFLVKTRVAHDRTRDTGPATDGGRDDD